MTGCSSKGEAESGGSASEVPNQVAKAAVSVDSETIITVSDPNSPLNGTKVVIPKGAAIDPITVVIGYEDNLPATLNANALKFRGSSGFQGNHTPCNRRRSINI